jgi:hypothetical protein
VIVYVYRGLDLAGGVNDSLKPRRRKKSENLAAVSPGQIVGRQIAQRREQIFGRAAAEARIQ